jgi:hypothetical protein
LPSNQLVNLAKRTFSNHLWLWWKDVQQGLIHHGDEPCTSWQDMWIVLEGKYEVAHEDLSQPKKIVAKGGDNSFGTKKNMHSSWSDPIVGVESPSLPHCRKKSTTRSQHFLRHEHLPSSISRSFEKCTEPSVTRKEKTKIPIVGCTTRSGYVMGDEFHPLVIQQASMPMCDPKKKAAVGDQNFLGSTKQHNKHCSRSFSEICSPPKEHKKNFATVKGDENWGVCIAESSSPAQQSGNNCATAIDTRKELSTSLTIHGSTEPLPTDDIDALNRISLMSQEVQYDGTTAAVKGQHSGIFQSECKIKDKACKLIIDGRSFANVISSDLVSALPFSMWRLLMPYYVQWMNQSGTLKITHKARVRFSVGNYSVIIDCDVAPMSVCHLLLGRPWQYDLDATHSRRSNHYSFVHRGVSHVLKPIKESIIKAKVFVTVKSRKPAKTIPMSRMTLFQGEENDVAIVGDDLKANCNSKVAEIMSDLIDISAKPRTALILGRQNDKCINHQVHSTTYVKDSENISVAKSKKRIFVGANLCNNENKIDDMSYILI